MTSSPSLRFTETHSGAQFTPLALGSAHICIEDIAASLSKLCRYGGACQVFYSVAEHCVHLCDYTARRGMVPKAQMLALMHDASEAYLVDIPRPIKELLPDYRALEAELEAEIMRRFDLPYPFPAWLKSYDGRILRDERAAIMSASGHRWDTDHLEPLGDIPIAGWSPALAARKFLSRYHDLTAKITAQEGGA